MSGQLTGEPAPSPVQQTGSAVSGARKGLSRPQQAGLVATCVAAAVVVFMLQGNSPPAKRDETVPLAVGGTSDPFRPPVIPAQVVAPPPPALPMPVAQSMPTLPSMGTKTDPRQAARESDINGWSTGGGQPTRVSTGARTGDPAAGGADNTPLAQRLQATRLEGSKAAVLPHPDLTITMGTPIPCLPDQPMNSQMPGIVSCHVPIDVRGTTGRVVLLDRGTKIVGQIQGGLLQGQNRLFVNWSRAETPNPDHVIITLNSPGADVIGEPGLDGDINTHFWQRFGGAILLSFIDTSFQAAVLEASKGGGNGVQFNSFQSGGENAATAALQNSVNIPPTLHRDQALPIVVFTARDLDFSGVYQLRETGLR
jgi:type IV secretion system protein VirB10